MNFQNPFEISYSRFRNIPKNEFSKTPLKSLNFEISKSKNGGNMFCDQNGIKYISKPNGLYKRSHSSHVRNDTRPRPL